MFASILQDVRFAIRGLRRSPVFTMVAVLSVAGGLAAGTGIFTVANAVLSRPIAVGDASGLYQVLVTGRSGGLNSTMSYPHYQAFAESPALGASCATTRVRGTLIAGGAARIHPGELMSPGCFEALRLVPGRGRFFSAAGATNAADAGATPVVISHALWLSRFAGAPDAIGRSVSLNGVPSTVVAVAPPRFAGTDVEFGADFWAPISREMVRAFLPVDALEDPRQPILMVHARVREGTGVIGAEVGLASVIARLAEGDATAWTNDAGALRTARLMTEQEARFAGSPAAAIGVRASALAAIAIIIAIACLNLSTMLLARGIARTREIAIRLAVGASRARVLRQFATESLIIAALGGAIALAVVAAGTRLYAAYRPSGVPAFDIALDWRVITFALVLATLAAMAFGMAPAAHALRIAVGEGLKGAGIAGRSRKNRGRLNLRDALIVLQVAVSIALFVVSTLFAGALSRGTPSAPGFTLAGVAAAEVHLDAIARSDLAATNARLLDAASRVPDVEGVTSAAVVPMTGSSVEVRLSLGGAEAERSAYTNIVAPGYFATLGIPLDGGRDFDARDRTGGAPTVILSRLLAERLFGTTQAVGRTVMIDSTWREVIGVVGDIRYRSLGEPETPLAYVPMAQAPRVRMVVHARYRGGATTLAAFEQGLRDVDARAAVESATPLEARMEAALVGERAARWAGGIIGAVQLFLALMALWGLVSYAVERRAPEMGVRLALGATPSSLVWLALRPAAALIAVGVVLGSVIGIAAARAAQSASVGLAPLDLTAVVPVSVAFAGVALLAAWWPARRAGRVQPAESLRRE